MRPYFYIIALILLSPIYASAATLQGKITDAKGIELPFAMVFIKNTTTGTAANAQGVYKLHLAAGRYTVVCQYMGFTQAEYTVTLKDGQTVVHDFVLQEQHMKLKGVTVKSDEDPAYAIIRKAIERRKFHLNQQNTFQSNIYLKGVFRMRDAPDQIFGIKVEDADGEGGGLSDQLGLDSNGRGVVYLCEQEVDYYAKDGKEKTIVKSVTESGDPNGLGMSRVPKVTSFYENNVTVMNGASERGFVSPISEGALRYYKYKYEGEFVENGYTVDRIKVTPKRLYEPLFSGTIYIVENDWSIHSLNLFVTSQTGLNGLDTLAVEQRYLPLRKDLWVIKNQVIFPTLTILGFDISGHFITVYDKQKINESIPDSLFNKKVISAYLPNANKKDSTYWDDKRPIPLEEDEVNNYVHQDSVLKKENDPERLDSMRKRGNSFGFTDLIVGGYSYAGKEYKHRFYTNSVLSGLVNYNTVEGLNVAPRLHWRYRVDTGKILHLEVAPRYGFSNESFNLFGKLTFTKNRKDWQGRSWNAGLEGGKYVFQYNQNSTVNPLNNVFTTIVYGKNHMKLYERWTGAAFFRQNYGNGLRWSVKAGYQRRLPLWNTSFYTWANHDMPRWTSNYPVTLAHVAWERHNAALVKFQVAYQPGVKYIQLPDAKRPIYSSWPVFFFQYEKGIPNIFNSKTDFDKWRFSIRDHMNMKLLGSIGYHLAVGGFMNDNYVSLPDMMHIADNQMATASPYLEGFQLAPYYLYSNTSKLYGEGHVEYNMNGLLTNKIPLFRKLQWHLLLGNNTLYLQNGSYYTEAFFSIDNIGYKLYRGMRVDFIKSWDDMQRNTIGIRIGWQLGGLINIGSNNQDNFDW